MGGSVTDGRTTENVMERKESNGKLWQFTLTIALDCLD